MPSDDTSGLKAWGDDMPGILGSPYIAPLGPERLLVGTTKEYDVSIADARSAGAVSAAEKGQRAQAALRAATKLMDASAAIFPPLSSMRVDSSALAGVGCPAGSGVSASSSGVELVFSPSKSVVLLQFSSYFSGLVCVSCSRLRNIHSVIRGETPLKPL